MRYSRIIGLNIKSVQARIFYAQTEIQTDRQGGRR
jgi:hypothetical protein